MPMEGKDSISIIKKMEEYKKMLLDISRNMDANSLKELKYLCQVKKARGEKMETALDVFDYLKETGKIDEDNVDFLIARLEDLKRILDANLVKDYKNKYEQQYYEVSPKGTGNITEKAVAQADDDEVDAALDSNLHDAFEYLKDHIGRKWREFARTQGLNQVDIHQIEDAYPRDLREQSFQALLLWEKKQKGQANVRGLVEDLRKRNFNQMANDIDSGRYKS